MTPLLDARTLSQMTSDEFIYRKAWRIELGTVERQNSGIPFWARGRSRQHRKSGQCAMVADKVNPLYNDLPLFSFASSLL